MLKNAKLEAKALRTIQNLSLIDKTLFIKELVELETAVELALQQIEEKQYAAELLARDVNRILFIGLAFEEKKVLIRSKTIDNSLN